MRLAGWLLSGALLLTPSLALAHGRFGGGHFGGGYGGPRVSVHGGWGGWGAGLRVGPGYYGGGYRSYGQVWIPGYWNWLGARYVWVQPAYAVPPQQNYVWIQPQWIWTNAGWQWQQGYWAPGGSQQPYAYAPPNVQQPPAPPAQQPQQQQPSYDSYPNTPNYNANPYPQQ